MCRMFAVVSDAPADCSDLLAAFEANAHRTALFQHDLRDVRRDAGPAAVLGDGLEQTVRDAF